MPFDAVTVPSPSDAELLITARSLIATPDRWCQHAYQRDYLWKPTERCAMGALISAQTSVYSKQQERRLARLLVREMPRRGGLLLRWFRADARVKIFNDHWHTKHAHVMMLFDRAIERQIGHVALAYRRPMAARPTLADKTVPALTTATVRKGRDFADVLAPRSYTRSACLARN